MVGLGSASRLFKTMYLYDLTSNIFYLGMMGPQLSMLPYLPVQVQQACVES